MNSMPLGTSLAALVAVLGGCATAAPSRCTTVPATHLVLSESACESPVPSGPEFTCGTLQLPEDAEQAESCMVEVAWARYEPASPRRAPPIFLLGGGPGGSILSDAQRAFDFARRAAPDRPWIIHDPRGAGRSQPRLDCAGFPRPAACAASYRSAGHDASRYSTEMLASDVNHLAEALDYGTIDVMGVSYGARLAYALASRYPDRTRALVLSAAAPVDAPLMQTPVGRYLRAMDRVLADCEASMDCRQWHGDVARAHHDNLTRLRAEPPSIAAPGGPRPLSSQLYVGLTFQLLASSRGPARLPAFIRAVASGDTRGAEQMLARLATKPAASAAFMHHAITCTEDLPVSSGDAARRDLAALPDFGDKPMLEMLRSRCKAYGLTPIEEQGSRPWWNDVAPLPEHVPVLTLNGRYDPLASSWLWNRTRFGVPELTRFEVPRASHATRESACGQALIARFLEDPSGQILKPPECANDNGTYFSETFTSLDHKADGP